jgi:hypothetical protein
VAAKISISLTDATLVDWAQRRAAREGKSVSAVFAELAERARRLEAMGEYLDWAGAPKLTAEQREEIRREIEGTSPPRRPRASAMTRPKGGRRRRNP